MRTDTIRLSNAGARAVHVAAQGLLSARRKRASKDSVLAAIQRMRLLQIDTIHVVARSPYLVLFSRLGPYSPAWLDELLEEGRIFESWAHEACFAPMSDWALLRSHLLDKGHHWALRNALRVRHEQAPGMLRMLDHIRSNGAVRSADFERSDGQRGGGWWGWKDEKRWLEAWFGLGELMVARREKFQRVYDLTERVLANAGVDASDGVDAGSPTRQVLIERSILALGIARASWIADYFRLRPRVDALELSPLIAAGLIRQVDVAGWAEPGYVHVDLMPTLMAAASGRLRATLTTVLSPFDPVVWDRVRASELFGFDYRLECYLPAAKRRFGYFVLPVLHRGRLVARLDAKAHRGEGLFEIKSIELEPAVVVDDGLVSALASAIATFARWHGANRLSWGRMSPRNLAVPLRAAAKRIMAELADPNAIDPRRASTAG